ncbi:hypothetical protein D3C83_42730 [compost metagenome]
MSPMAFDARMNRKTVRMYGVQIAVHFPPRFGSTTESRTNSTMNSSGPAAPVGTRRVFRM